MGRNWNIEEDNLLRELIAQYGKQWSVIATHIPNRSATQIAARWEKCINPKLTKGPFTAEEDRTIVEFVEQQGCHAWPKITSVLPHRTPKQCRERWFNNLDPNVTKSPWTSEEDDLIFDNYYKIGPKWSTIAHLIPGRTDNSIKNRWNASISKRIKVDPDTGKQSLTPCKVRKYSKKNRLEAARPAALHISSIPVPALPTTFFTTATVSNVDNITISDLSDDFSSSLNSSPISETTVTFAPPSSCLTSIITPSSAMSFDIMDPFGASSMSLGVDDESNDLCSAASFGVNFHPFEDLCSPKFGLQSPLFSPTGNPLVFVDL